MAECCSKSGFWTPFPSLVAELLEETLRLAGNKELLNVWLLWLLDSLFTKELFSVWLIWLPQSLFRKELFSVWLIWLLESLFRKELFSVWLLWLLGSLFRNELLNFWLLWLPEFLFRNVGESPMVCLNLPNSLLFDGNLSCMGVTRVPCELVGEEDEKPELKPTKEMPLVFSLGLRLDCELWSA